MVGIRRTEVTVAQRVEVVRVDDLDGSAASGSIRFGIDGQAYEIDLSTANAARLRQILAPFIAAARRSEANALGQIPREPGTVPRPRSAGNAEARSENPPPPPESPSAPAAASAPRVRVPIPTNPFQVPS